MSDNYELFRNELITRLESSLPQDQLRSVLAAFDATSSSYEIQRRQLDVITSGGIPDVVKWYLASKSIENLSEKTLMQYRYKLEKFFAAVRKPFQDIRPNDVRLYLANFKQARGASDRYMDNIRLTLNGFFAWLVDNEYLMRNPCANIEKIKYQEKTREPLTAYQLEDLRWNCRSIREKALVDFFFSTGCRVSECAAVFLSDIDWSSRSVRIRHGKGNKERTVFFNAESELSLRKYLSTRDDDRDALFVSVRRPHNPLQPRALELIIRQIAERVNLRVFPHRLRHTFATSGLRGGMPLDKLQALMGHAKPETTLIYAKQDQTELRMEHRRVYA